MPIKFDLRKYANPCFIETGTFMGDGVQAALDAGFLKIVSIEVYEESWAACRERFAEQIAAGRVDLRLGDSARMLRAVMADIDTTVTFWLDGHGGYPGTGTGLKTCPLYEELDQIANHHLSSHTILIDDRRLWGRDIYGWKDIDERRIVDRIRAINPGYEFGYECGRVEDDVLVARVPA